MKAMAYYCPDSRCLLLRLPCSQGGVLVGFDMIQRTTKCTFSTERIQHAQHIAKRAMRNQLHLHTCGVAVQRELLSQLS